MEWKYRELWRHIKSDIFAENLRSKLELVEESKNKYAKQRKQYHIWKPVDKREVCILKELKSVWLEQKTRKEMMETSYKARHWLSQIVLKF